jgi:hypothetical protein
MRCSIARFFALVLLSCIWLACSNDPPIAPRGYTLPTDDAGGIDRYRFALAPIEGLTTVWHPVPPVVVVPVGTTVRIKYGAARDAVVVWTGAVEVERTETASIAECPTHEAGRIEIKVGDGSGDSGPGDGKTKPGSSSTSITPHSCVVIGVAVPPGGVRVAAVSATVSPLELDENSSNEETMLAYFGGGKRLQEISSLRAVGPDRYRTAAGRRVRFEGTASPAAFTPMIEWRAPGARPRLAGSFEDVFASVGHNKVELGPPGRARTVDVETYSVRIRLAESVDGAVSEDVPAVFVAETTPRGYENEVTWITSTKYGRAIPVVGHGRMFTAVFTQTYGPNPEGGEWSWLGVRADNAFFDQDAKFGPTPSQDWEVTGIDAAALGVHAMPVLVTPMLYTPTVPSDQWFRVDPFTEAVFRLDYTGQDHLPHHAITNAEVDNVAMQIRVNGLPVSSLAGIFSLPVSALPGPTAIMTVAYTRPILSDCVLAQDKLKGPKWKLDNGNFLPNDQFSTDFDPKSPDLTPGQESELLKELKNNYGLADTSAAGLKRNGPPKDSFNCHGYTFLKSERWMNGRGNTVKDIVGAGNPNGYGEVGPGTGTKAKVGDVVVYEKNGVVTHSGKVTAVDGDGNPTKVEGKWGNMGTYEHAPGNVPNYFGTPKYYHTDRAGGNCVTRVAC